MYPAEASMSEQFPPPRSARRSRHTPLSVRFGEIAARLLISLGGAGTIAAVCLIFLFLLWVVAPLFRAPAVVSTEAAPLAAADSQATVQVGADEYGDLAWRLLADGTFEVLRTADGTVLSRRELFPGRRPTCARVQDYTGLAAFGFEDGSMVRGKIVFETSYLSPTERSPKLEALGVGERTVWQGGLVTRLEGDQWRCVRVDLELQDPVRLVQGQAILALDMAGSQSISSQSERVAAFTADGELHVDLVRRRQNLLTEEWTTEVREYEVPYRRPSDRGPPRFLRLSGNGSTLYLAWEDGYLQRYDLRDLEHPALPQEFDLVPEEGERLTHLSFLLGGTTLLSGDTLGRLGGWFAVEPPPGDASLGVRLVNAHPAKLGNAPVAWIASSQRQRLAAVALGDGRTFLRHITTDRTLLELGADGETGGSTDGASIAVCILPRDDGLLRFAGSSLARWTFDLAYPEARPAALFRPIWYEGAPGPKHVWQSSSGTDDFEPKMGLVPLVFGTVKATVYSMLFGAPIAILGAIFSSEFLRPRVRAALKSLVEIMASLPSVVLGFLAAMVIAPLVQGMVPAVLASFVTLPLCMLLGAYAFQLLPQQVSLRLSGTPRFGLILLTLVPGVLLARVVGAWGERVLFRGDLISWLNGEGSPIGGWTVLLLPLAACAVVWAMGRWLTPRTRRWSLAWSRARCAWFDLGKFLVGLVATLALAYLLGGGLSLAGADPRGEGLGLLSTYVQRNALVVGFVMGFAIIPIIYTLAEDALSSVPGHLREASLGAGATPWQTAMMVVVPTAMSGLFSALMIGLGRAVGETMIVLMATGNTPVMEWNIFNGFRTLSANIAVELPEAVKDSTHYRVLFLSALVLFSMTFVINTLAEAVRQRFRKRAYQL